MEYDQIEMMERMQDIRLLQSACKAAKGISCTGTVDSSPGAAWEKLTSHALRRDGISAG